MGRKATSNKSTPTVIDGRLYTDDPDWTGIDLAGPDWYAWLNSLEPQPFYFRYGEQGFSVRPQHHRRGWFWYAYKRIAGRQHKRYLGMAENVKLPRLIEMAEQFAALAEK